MKITVIESRGFSDYAKMTEILSNKLRFQRSFQGVENRNETTPIAIISTIRKIQDKTNKLF